jgi:lycopene beta-cyclase
MRDRLGARLHLGVDVVSLSATSVTTAEGLTWKAQLVIDARSAPPNSQTEDVHLNWGFQKFVGMEIETSTPHGLPTPLLMDAQVPQTDGYRFFYVLPLTNNHLLIEDTYYSNGASLSIPYCQQEIRAYAQKQGWSIQREVRTEYGVLPIPTQPHYDQASDNLKKKDQALEVGTRVGFYHPITGYSFLWSTRVAERLSAVSSLDPEAFRSTLLELHQERQQNERFYLFLNRLMFYGADSTNRYRIFERFYRLPQQTIVRFYAGQSNWMDRLRLLVGEPPIPISAALRVIFCSGTKSSLPLLSRGERS